MRDVDETVRFLRTAFPEFIPRWRADYRGGRWVHVGTGDVYLTRIRHHQGGRGRTRVPYAGTPGTNLGFEVDDVGQCARGGREATRLRRSTNAHRITQAGALTTATRTTGSSCGICRTIPRSVFTLG